LSSQAVESLEEFDLGEQVEVICHYCGRPATRIVTYGESEPTDFPTPCCDVCAGEEIYRVLHPDGVDDDFDDGDFEDGPDDSRRPEGCE